MIQQQIVETRPIIEGTPETADISWIESYRNIISPAYRQHLFTQFGINFDPSLHSEILEQSSMVLIPIGVEGGSVMEWSDGQRVMRSHDLVSKAVIVSHLIDDYIDFPILHIDHRDELEQAVLGCVPSDTTSDSVHNSYTLLKKLVLDGVRNFKTPTSDHSNEVIRGGDQAELLDTVLTELEASLEPDNLRTFELSLIRLATAGLAQTVPFLQEELELDFEVAVSRQASLMSKYRELGIAQLSDQSLIIAKNRVPSQIEVSTASSSQEMFQVFDGEVDFDLLEAWNNILGVAVYANKSIEERKERHFGFYDQAHIQDTDLAEQYRNLIHLSWDVIKERANGGDFRIGSSNHARLLQFRLVYALLSRPGSSHSFGTIESELSQMLAGEYKKIDEEAKNFVPDSMLSAYLAS